MFLTLITKPLPAPTLILLLHLYYNLQLTNVQTFKSKNLISYSQTSFFLFNNVTTFHFILTFTYGHLPLCMQKYIYAKNNLF